MSENEFIVLKAMVSDVASKVETLITAIYEYKLEVSQKFSDVHGRITKIEQHCIDQHDSSRRLTDNLYKTMPIGISVITLIILLWNTLKG